MTRTTALALQVNVPQYLENTVADIVAFLPRLVAALVVLLIGWVVGVAVARVVSRLTDAVELDRMVLDTPLGRIMGGSRQAVSNTFGAIAKWFVYALAILAAANVLAIPLLSEWISTAVSYLPAFIAGLAVIVIGFVVADFIGDAIAKTRAATEDLHVVVRDRNADVPLLHRDRDRTGHDGHRRQHPLRVRQRHRVGASPRPSPSASASPSAGAATSTSPTTSTSGWAASEGRQARKSRARPTAEATPQLTATNASRRPTRRWLPRQSPLTARSGTSRPRPGRA